MFNINYTPLEGLVTISDTYNISATPSQIDATPYFNNIGDEYVMSFINLENINNFNRFVFDTLGTSETRFLSTFYKTSRNGVKWTNWLELKTNIDNFPLVDPLDPLFIDIKWVREGNSQIGTIRLIEYLLEGSIGRAVTEDGSVVTLNVGDSHIIKPPFIFKVFKIDDLEIISATGILPGTELKYRYSQDNSRTWSKWEILTKENITTTRINPVRFFEIEYFIENNSTSQVRIQDINLIGSFQNVTKDSQKTNLFGIRECCQTFLDTTYDSNGNIVVNTNLNSSGENCDSPFKPMTVDERAQLYNPYSQNTAVNLLNQLSNDAQQMFGHKVIYFVTDPDRKGYDYSLHEYSLYNVVCESEIKVSVQDNNFPDSQITMNQFDLNLFETMEVHITKEQFKQAFGVQRRPSKEDFLYFCNLSRIYQVDHAQQFRVFNNTAVYYKLILKKYTQKANVQSGTDEIKNKIDMLTQNSTIDSLFGLENKQDKLSIANKQEFVPLTRDPIRFKYNAKINKELIENSSTVISKSHYDLSSVEFETGIGVEYFNLDPITKVSDNIGFTIWFNMNNYMKDEVYNFFTHYDVDNELGWKVNLVNDVVKVKMNSVEYLFDLDVSSIDMNAALEEEVWYCYVLNIDQRNNKMYQYIYKRDVDDEDDASRLHTTILRRIHSNEQDIVPIEFEVENTNPVIFGSDMKLTNLRLFIDVIPEDTHNKILNQYVMREDSKYLVFADNANTRLFLPSFPLFE